MQIKPQKIFLGLIVACFRGLMIDDHDSDLVHQVKYTKKAFIFFFTFYCSIYFYWDLAEKNILCNHLG